MSWHEELFGDFDLGDLIGIGAPVAGAVIASGASERAAEIEAASIEAQGVRQDRLARDTQATGIAYANEQRDITLGASDYTRLGSASSYAAMMDMLGLDRSQIPFAPGASGTPGGGAGATGATGGGVSQYTPGYNYDLNRLNEPNSIVANAPRYDFQADPGYNFRFDEGMRGLENSAAARGGLLSGKFARNAQVYGQNVASDEYGKIFNRLSRTAGFGVGASGGSGGAGITAAGLAGVEAAGSIGAAGSARSQGQVGAANAWSSAFDQIGRNLGAN